MKTCSIALLALALLSSAFCNTVHAQNIDQLAWMTGSWAQVKEGETVRESWLGPQGKLMVAVNLSLSQRRGTTFEFLRIAETANGLAYYASPQGKTPVEFKLKEMSEKKVTFENPTHDFPRRILYWMATDGAMHARIEGNIQGKERTIEWRFEREKNRAVAHLRFEMTGEYFD